MLRLSLRLALACSLLFRPADAAVEELQLSGASPFGAAPSSYSDLRVFEDLVTLAQKVDPNTAMSLITKLLDSLPRDKLAGADKAARNERFRGGPAAATRAFFNGGDSDYTSDYLMLVKIRPTRDRELTLTVRRDGSISQQTTSDHSS